MCSFGWMAWLWLAWHACRMALACSSMFRIRHRDDSKAPRRPRLRSGSGSPARGTSCALGRWYRVSVLDGTDQSLLLRIHTLRCSVPGLINLSLACGGACGRRKPCVPEQKGGTRAHLAFGVESYLPRGSRVVVSWPASIIASCGSVRIPTSTIK